MRIGLDFDNTIVNYDFLFHKVAREQDVIPLDIPVNKVAVRDYLRRTNREEIWTEMQGLVYGARMSEALSYPGVIEFLRWVGHVGHEIAIISHKTKNPFLGPKYDLHAAASTWIEKNLSENGNYLVPPDQVFFKLTKEEKLACIGDFACDVFLDDLPEILNARGFPTSTRRILFDPEGQYATEIMPSVTVVKSWQGFRQCL